MMLRPALRTSHSAFCGAVVGHLDDAARQAEVAHQLDQRPQPAQQLALVVAAELDQQDRRRRRRSARVSIVGRNAGLARARSIIVRSTSSTAVGPSLTMCCAASIAARKVGKLTTPSTLLRGSGASFSFRLRVDGERAFGADQQVREVDAAVGGVRPFALRIEDVEVVAADPAQHLRPARLDLGAVLDRRGRARSRRSRVPSRRARRAGRTTASLPSLSQASMPSTLCTMLP